MVQFFFECTANSAGGERLRREGETSRSRGETGDIILLNESLRFIKNVASCYRLGQYPNFDTVKPPPYFTSVYGITVNNKKIMT